MSIWLYVRAILVTFAAISSFFLPLTPQAKPPIDGVTLLIIFAASLIVFILVVGLQALNPRSAAIWRRPSWRLNPFNFHEPLQFFHLGAYVFLAQGLVTLLRLSFSPVPFYAEALVPLVISAGILLGTRVVMFLCRSKMEAGT